MINSSRQAIIQYAEVQEYLGIGHKGTESYLALLDDMRNVIEHLNNSAIQFGTVTPESNVKSNNSQLYFDTTTSTMYTNPAIDSLTGWVAV
jgi:hypothetical protein